MSKTYCHTCRTRAERRHDAEDRNKVHATRTISEQLALIESRPGSSIRESTRLLVAQKKVS